MTIIDDYFPSSVQTAYVFPHFYDSILSCFNVHEPTCTCPKDTPDDKMASAEAFIVDIFSY
jgi:hypothetical protein